MAVKVAADVIVVFRVMVDSIVVGIGTSSVVVTVVVIVVNTREAEG